MNQSAEQVTVELRDRVGVVTLNRPERLNAVTAEVFVDLERALRAVGADADCRAVVLTGAGRAFCSGMDLSADAAAGDPVQTAYAALRAGAAGVVAMREIPQPVIAAVRGHAVGAGFALAAAADIRICAPDAQFNAVFVKIGISAGDLGLSWFLPRLIGWSHAAELCYTGGVLDAAGAAELNLVSRVVADPVAEALDVAHQIAAMPPLGTQMTKNLLNASIGFSGFREHLELELRSQVIGLLTEDHRDAVRRHRTRRR